MESREDRQGLIQCDPGLWGEEDRSGRPWDMLRSPLVISCTRAAEFGEVMETHISERQTVMSTSMTKIGALSNLYPGWPDMQGSPRTDPFGSGELEVFGFRSCELTSSWRLNDAVLRARSETAPGGGPGPCSAAVAPSSVARRKWPKSAGQSARGFLAAPTVLRRNTVRLAPTRVRTRNVYGSLDPTGHAGLRAWMEASGQEA